MNTDKKKIRWLEKKSIRQKWIARYPASTRGSIFAMEFLALGIWLFLNDSVFFLLLSVFIRVHPWFHSGARACKAAAWFYGHAAAAAKWAFRGVVALDLEVHQSFGANRQLDFSAAAINQRACGHDASSCFFQHADGLARRAARGPHIFHDQYVFVRLDSKSPAQSQRSQRIPFHENRANGFAVRMRRNRPRHFVSDDEPAQSRGRHAIHAQIHDFRRQRPPQLLRVLRILQNERTLHVRAAMQGRS